MSTSWQSPSITGFYRIFDEKCLKIRGIATASVRTGFAMTIFFELPDKSEFIVFFDDPVSINSITAWTPGLFSHPGQYASDNVHSAPPVQHLHQIIAGAAVGFNNDRAVIGKGHVPADYQDFIAFQRAL